MQNSQKTETLRAKTSQRQFDRRDRNKEEKKKKKWLWKVLDKMPRSKCDNSSKNVSFSKIVNLNVSRGGQHRIGKGLKIAKKIKNGFNVMLRSSGLI